MTAEDAMYEINIRQQHFRFNELEKVVSLENHFNVPLWNIEQKSNYIESILCRVNLSNIYLDGSDKGWKIINGYNRILSYIEYSNNKFPLTGMKILEEFEGKYWNDLPFRFKPALESYPIVGQVINPGVPKSIKEIIYKFVQID